MQILYCVIYNSTETPVSRTFISSYTDQLKYGDELFVFQNNTRRIASDNGYNNRHPGKCVAVKDRDDFAGCFCHIVRPKTNTKDRSLDSTALSP